MSRSKATKLTLVVLLLGIRFTPYQGNSLTYGDVQNNTTIPPSGLQTNSENIGGWFWEIIDVLVKHLFMIDMLPYWMPLNEGNTKTFRYTLPQIEQTFGYTLTVTGTEPVKGIEAVKLVVTESDYPFGDAAKGCYRSYLPDLSQGKTLLKEYFENNQGGYYEIFAPFRNLSRYLLSIPGSKNSSYHSIGCYKGDNTLVDTGFQVVNTTFLGFEDVTVPAGTFKECLKTSVRFTANYHKEYEDRKQGISVEDIIWEAKGVGIVKIKTAEVIFINEHDDQSPDNIVMGGGVSELISATVDGASYPKE